MDALHARGYPVPAHYRAVLAAAAEDRGGVSR